MLMTVLWEHIRKMRLLVPRRNALLEGQFPAQAETTRTLSVANSCLSDGQLRTVTAPGKAAPSRSLLSPPSDYSSFLTWH